MNLLTPDEAKQYLAKKLPERIRIEKGYCTYNREYQYFAHKDKNCYGQDTHILETEWQQIALWFEEKMTKSQKAYYYEFLCDLYPEPLDIVDMISTNYITRATALKEAGITI